MFGLSIEKILIIGLVAALIIGPARLPMVAATIGGLIRTLRSSVDRAKTQLESELGAAVATEQWQQDLRQYDPRRIVRDALREPAPAADAPTRPAADRPPEQEPVEEASTGAAEATPEVPMRWVVTGGSSGHPRRRLVPVEPEATHDELLAADPERADVSQITA